MKEKEVYSKYFLFKVFCRFSQTACQKNVLMMTKVTYCFALDRDNTGIIQSVDKSTTLKNFKEVKLRFMLESLCT